MYVPPQGHERWQELRDFVGRSPDGAYTLRDYRCSEFEEIVRSVRNSRRQGTHQQMLELLHLLDKLWDKEYRHYSFARCYNGSNENYLEKSIPSAFHQALRDLAWLPAVPLLTQKPYGKPDQLYRGQELFDKSKANLRLLDCHVPYLACEIKNPHLLEVLKVKCQVNVDEMVGFLQEWAKAASAPGARFRASIAHMIEVYLFLYHQSQQMYHRGQTGRSIVDRLSSGDLNPIFVPDIYDKNIPLTEKVTGRFYSVHNVCWVDPSGVLYSKQQYNHTIPLDLPKILQLYYGMEEVGSQRCLELKTALMHFGVRETPTAAAYLKTLQFNSSLAAIPEKHHINDFTSIALHLSRVCMKGDISPQFLQQQLRDVKVFPSHRDHWVSMDTSQENCLLENDDVNLEKIFGECKNVHFLKWPEAALKKGSRFRRIEEQQKEDERKHFIGVCDIANLSEVVQSSVMPDKGMVMPLVDLRRRLHEMVPLLQRYLVANEEELYQSLVQGNIKEKLQKMFIGSVLSLKCIYSIQHHGFSCTSPSQTSPGSDFTDSTEDDSAALYVVASKVDNPKVLVPTLIKIFSGKRGKFLNLSRFESLVKDMLMTPVGEIESEVSEMYTFGEIDADSIWAIPFEEAPESSESELEEDESDSAPSPTAESTKVGDAQSESDGLRSWPPKAPVSVGGASKYPPKPPPSGSAVADVVGEEDIQKISEKYAMGKRAVARLPSRQDQQPGEREGEPSKQSRGDDRNAPAINSPNERQESMSVAPSFDRQVSAAKETRGGSHSSEEKREQQQQQEQIRGEQHDVVHDTTQDVRPKAATVGRREGSPRERDGSMEGHRGLGGERRDGRWHEAVRPDAALYAQGGFSVATALQPISVESAEDFLNRSFLESCDQDSQERVGRWGEEYVYKFLTASTHLPGGQKILSVTWINEDTETGKPYDLEVQIEPQNLLYIEVKSTKSSEKEFMHFSWNELQLADKEKQNYHLYRVYNAGSELVTLKWMENLSSILTTHPVRLFLEL